MSMIDVLEKEFVNKKLVEGNTPELVTAIANSIPSTSIPYRMKLAIAYSELILFFSQFRINIRHWYGDLIPVNAITFCIAKSGASKDRSVNVCRKCFEDGYKFIEIHRKANAINNAINSAREAGVENYDSFAGYKKYYKIPNPLFISISTPEGLIQHLTDLKDDSIGAGYLAVSELGAEIAGNINFGETIKIVSELYDMGNKNAKIIKNKEQQNKEVKEFPMSAMLLGSPSNILYDVQIKKKFKMEFTSKLARRSFFIFANEDLTSNIEIDVDEMIKRDTELENQSIEYRKKVNSYIHNIAEEYMLPDAPKELKVTDEVRDLFNFYLRYNEAEANIISERFPMTKLSRNHLQWKAFKLAGALALSECSVSIEERHFRAGIEYCELIADDIHNFEIELTKEPYELFVSYVHEYKIDGSYSISLHELKKAEFISKGLSKTALQELVKYANSYDKNGTYALDGDNISFTQKESSDYILLSYLACTGSKAQRGVKCASGFRCEETTFSKLKELLEGDYAYSCFKFANGIRGIANIVSNTRWVILDIDDTNCTDEDAHFLLGGINHYVVRTSNKDNPNKFRVLIELNKEVNIPDYYWSSFIKKIAYDLGFICDARSKAQIYFSYSDRNILYELDGKPLDVDIYTKNLNILEKAYKPKELNLTDKQKELMLEDKFTTFSRAYNAKDGEGRVKLIWAIKRARELGASKDYTKRLIYNIAKEYWVKPLDNNSIDAMYRQIDKMGGFA